MQVTLVASAAGTRCVPELGSPGSGVSVGLSDDLSVLQGWTCVWSGSTAASIAASAPLAPSTANATRATGSTWMEKPVPVKTVSLS